jgi:K+-transporting ATPase A subunit
MYVSPTTKRVTDISPGMISVPSTKKTSNPLGLTDEQFQAAVAGVAAVIAFSKPVQEKLADVIPKFLSEAGDLTTTGMLVTALIAAVLFFFATKFLKQ